MTLTNPPYAIQASSHGAQLFREAVASLITPVGGIIQPQDFTIAQNGSPNMTVNVGAGRIWTPGTSLATVNPGGGAYYPQGLYYSENDATVNLAIAASNPTNPRIDTVIVQIQDAAYAGATNSASLAVLTGTPTAGATLANLLGAAAVPASSTVVGYVLVPANASSIVTADIASVAAQATSFLPPAVAGAGRGGAVNIAGAQSTASATFTTLTTPDQVTGVVLPANGLIAVAYDAIWSSTTGTGQAQIYLGGTPVSLPNAIMGGSASTNYRLYVNGASGLTGTAVGGYTGLGSGTPTGGFIWIPATAGTYTVSVQFEATGGGTITASSRHLWVQALSFA